MLGQKFGMSAPALELLRIKPTRSVHIPTVSINSIVIALKKKMRILTERWAFCGYLAGGMEEELEWIWI